MTDSDKKEFAQIMYGLADNFSASVTPEGMRFRFDCLRQYDLAQISKAAGFIVKTRKYTKMPTIADFIEAIEGTPEDKGEEQAMKVIAAISQIGRYNSPKFEDPKTASLVAQIGWVNLCDMHTDKHKFFVKDFIESYKSEARRTETAKISGVESDVKRLLAGITKGIEA